MYVEEVSPRRTQLIGKRASSGWKLVNDNEIGNYRGFRYREKRIVKGISWLRGRQCMKERRLKLDTNILFNALDRGAGERLRLATEIVNRAIDQSASSQFSTFRPLILEKGRILAVTTMY